MKERLIITGSSGRIGHILWKGLSDSYELYGLDYGPSSTEANQFRADITKPDQVEAAFDRVPRLSYVIHLAGDSRSDADWPSAFHINIGGTKNVYAAAQGHGVKRVIFASSNHVTGAHEGFPPSLHTKPPTTLITTHDPIRPDGFYGVSKAAGEAIARMYYEVCGLESVCLRIGSVNEEDSPATDPRLRSTWLSHRDLLTLVKCSLEADVKFGVYYGVSMNRRRFWDISDADRDLGYRPVDDGSREDGR